MILVVINKDHIRKGLRGSYNLDAFGKAVTDAIVKEMKRPRNSFKLIATNRDILFIDGYMLDIPEIAQEFIRRSDFGEPLAPTQFELDIPDDLFEPREHSRYE